MESGRAVTLVDQGIVEVINLDDGEKICRHIEHCARVSYKSWDMETPGSAKRFVDMIVRLKHESVLEHWTVTFVLKCDRATCQQLTRHRLASFTMESQRYVNYSLGKFGGAVEFIRPQFPPSENAGAVIARWTESCGASEAAYFDLLRLGLKPEDARSVLPSCAASTVAMTANVREWRTILKTRLDPHAQRPIRELCGLILAEFRRVAPELVSDITS
jgi:thymidylate synthase (FAD)